MPKSLRAALQEGSEVGQEVPGRLESQARSQKIDGAHRNGHLASGGALTWYLGQSANLL
jgi:hypothetical protein